VRQALPYVYVAPSLLVLGAFGLLPVLFTAGVSLFRWDAVEGLDSVRFSGIENFVWVFQSDDWFGSALTRAWSRTLVTGVMVHLTAIPLAVFINQAFGRWRAAVMALYFIPFLAGGVVIGVVWQAMFSSGAGGLVNAAVNALGGIEVFGFHPLSFAFPTAPVRWFHEHGESLRILAAWWNQLGWNVLLYVSALQYLPKDMLDAARLDGASPWQSLRFVIVPQLRPMILFAASLTLVAGLADASDRSLADYMNYMAFEVGDYGATAAMAIVVLAMLAGAVVLLWALLSDTRREKKAAPDATHWRARGKAWLRRVLLVPDAGPGEGLRGVAGLRAIACLMVVVHHLFQRLDGDATLLWVLKPVWGLGLNMDMGVSIFFVLSGTLLSYPFWQRYLANQAPPSLADYALRRAARIAPGYWVALFSSAALGLLAIPEAPDVLLRLVTGALFVSGLHYTTLFPTELDPVLWSISFEVICYALLPLLMWPLWRRPAGGSARRAFVYLLWVLAALQFAHLVIVASFMTDEAGKGWVHGLLGGAKEWIPYWNPATFMTQFLLGGLAALAIAQRRRDPFPSNADFDKRATWALLAAWGLYALIGSGVSVVTRQPYLTPMFPGLCAFALYAMQFGHRLHRWLDNRVFRYVATRSFGLYLWHFVVIELVRVYIAPDYKVFIMRSVGEWALLSLFVLIASLLLADLSWRFVEKPVLDWARRRSPPSGRDTALATAAPRARKTAPKWRWHRHRRVSMAAVCAVGALMVLPFYLMLVFATQPEAAIRAAPPPFWFGAAFQANLAKLIAQRPLFWQNLAMSLRVSAGTAVLQMLLCSLAGYAFALMKFRGRELLFAVLLGTLLLPGFLRMIPHTLLINWLGWMDTARSLIVPGASSAIGIFLMRQYIGHAVPPGVVEAARLDGCSSFGIYWRIVLPLCAPALGALGLIAFVASWNDVISPLTTMHDMGAYTAPLAMRSLIGSVDAPWNALFAGSVLLMLPLFVLFALCARQVFQTLSLDAGQVR
jgi:ABC-type glycerol-3-phosphate transport system permease component/peptidoglycan/LPS O-acetylase OafA/YrhL